MISMDELGIREENLNVTLADLLAERGLKALGEVVVKRPTKHQPDVLVVINGMRIVIEGKRPGFWAQLEAQAKRRLEDNICEIVVMVEYLSVPLNRLEYTQAELREALLRGRYNVGVMTYVEAAGLERFLGEGGRAEVEVYRDVDFHDLVTYVMQAYERAVREDIIAPVVAKIEAVLSDFSSSVVDCVDPERLKEILEIGEREEE